MSVLATDAFTRADETPLASPWGNRDVSGDRGCDLRSNAATYHTAANVDDARSWYDNGISWPNDQYSQAKLTITGTAGSGSGVGLSLRNATGAKTLYRFVIDHAGSTNWEIGVLSAGSFVSISTGTQAFSDGDTFKFTIIGSNLSVQLNGAAAFGTGSDVAIASGKPGLGYSSTETSVSMDDFEGGDTSAAGPWPLIFTYGTDPVIQLWDWVGLY